MVSTWDICTYRKAQTSLRKCATRQSLRCSHTETLGVDEDLD